MGGRKKGVTPKKEKEPKLLFPVESHDGGCPIKL